MSQPRLHGLVIGKFYPPHLGHHHVIHTAAGACRRVTVVVMAARRESIPLADRVKWLEVEHRDTPNVRIIGIPCEAPTDLKNPQVWRAQIELMRAAICAADCSGDPVDTVFTSEQYGAELARGFNAEHVMVDYDRDAVPVSATRVREDLWGMWDMLSPPVRRGLCTRIVVVGAESTGTSTLTEDLTQHYKEKGWIWGRTRSVPEHGRDYTVTKLAEAREAAAQAGLPEPSMDDLVWTREDFARIAVKQNICECLAATTSSPVLFCDTDAFATRIWERRYIGEGSDATETAVPDVCLPPHAVYLITNHEGVPFVQDGIRDGEHIRTDMTGWFITELTRHGFPWVLMTGTREERLALAIRITDRLLEERRTFALPLDQV